MPAAALRAAAADAVDAAAVEKLTPCGKASADIVFEKLIGAGGKCADNTEAGRCSGSQEPEPESPQESPREPESEPEGAGARPRQKTVTIFDWDDTLLCSSFLRAHAKDEDAALPSGVLPHFRSIEAAAARLLELAARRGECVIVTNAVEGWVEYSAAKYLPSVCEVLGKVRIVSARSVHGESMPGQVGRWKAEAFRAVCEQFADEGVRLNLTVIGDSELEMNAARAMRQEFEHALVKTVKLQELPSPEDLSKAFYGLRGASEELEKQVEDFQELAVVSQKFEKILAAPRELSISLARKWPGRTP